MGLDADLLVDRRRLKRGLALWRIVAIVGIAVLAVVALGRAGGFPARDHVARLTVDGLVVADRDVLAAIDAVAEDESAKALLVAIDSPGGTFVGGESLHDALRRVAAVKPVVALMGTLATSGGYMVALAADRIYAYEGTITGSIGVILQTAEFTRLLDKLGIRAEAIKSAPLKATPSPLEPLTEQTRAEIQAVIDDMYGRFKAMVAERRGLDPARVRALADGRVFTGRQALADGLIDAIGAEHEARGWLAEARGVSEDLPVIDVEVRQPIDELLASVKGLSKNMVFSERLSLDGLIALWHPSG